MLLETLVLLLRLFRSQAEFGDTLVSQRHEITEATTICVTTRLKGPEKSYENMTQVHTTDAREIFPLGLSTFHRYRNINKQKRNQTIETNQRKFQHTTQEPIGL